MVLCLDPLSEKEAYIRLTTSSNMHKLTYINTHVIIISADPHTDVTLGYRESSHKPFLKLEEIMQRKAYKHCTPPNLISV